MNDSKYYYGIIRDNGTRMVVSHVREDDIHHVNEDIVYINLVKKIHFLKIQ